MITCWWCWGGGVHGVIEAFPSWIWILSLDFTCCSLIQEDFLMSRKFLTKREKSYWVNNNSWYGWKWFRYLSQDFGHPAPRHYLLWWYLPMKKSLSRKLSVLRGSVKQGSAKLSRNGFGGILLAWGMLHLKWDLSRTDPVVFALWMWSRWGVSTPHWMAIDANSLLILRMI